MISQVKARGCVALTSPYCLKVVVSGSSMMFKSIPLILLSPLGSRHITSRALIKNYHVTTSRQLQAIRYAAHPINNPDITFTLLIAEVNLINSRDNFPHTFYNYIPYLHIYTILSWC